jgi:transposase-like protein
LSKKRTAGQAGRRRLDRATGLALVERWRASGLSVPAYGREQNVAEHILRYWIAEAKRETGRNDFFVVTTNEGQDKHIEKPNRRQVDGHAVVIVVPLSSKDALASTLRAALEVGA